MYHGVTLLLGLVIWVGGGKADLMRGICDEGYKQCQTVSICIADELVCDGITICPDESDEKYCAVPTEINRTMATTMGFDSTTPSRLDNDFVHDALLDVPLSEESANLGSMEKEQDFLVDKDADHCDHYRRMIHLVKRVHTRMGRLDARTSKLIMLLINEILMEAGMENFSSLLELYHVCNYQNEEKQNRRHHHQHHSTTTTTTTTAATTD